MSPECRSELHFFMRRADKLGIKELLLPLYYLDIPSFNENPIEDDLLRMVSEFHWQNWRELRYAEVTSEAYRRGVDKMAKLLVKANKHAEESNVAEAALEMEGRGGGEKRETTHWA